MPFLVGPVEMRPQGQLDRILEMPEHGLEVGLAVMALDDLGGRPVVAISDQDDAAQAVAGEGVKGLAVKRVCERQRGGLAGDPTCSSCTRC